MSVEALWVVRYGGSSMPSIISGYSNAGVVVLETGRVFGGDAGYYYIGKYEVNGNNIKGRVRVTHFNGPLVDAFRTGQKSFEIDFVATVSGSQIQGEMYPVDMQDRRLPIVMELKATLP
jgi:hypothetical protein